MPRLLVKLDHPHGTVEIPLEEWIRVGPGELPYLKPIAVRDVDTGRPLPMRVIPLRYRNTAFSRFLIRLGFLKEPWRS